LLFPPVRDFKKWKETEVEEIWVDKKHPMEKRPAEPMAEKPKAGQQAKQKEAAPAKN
jgi:hypothetical protein